MNEARDINTLSRETGISVRTIRYYLAQDLLPPPAGRGPATGKHYARTGGVRTGDDHPAAGGG